MRGSIIFLLKNVQKNQEIKIGCMPVLAPYHFARMVADFKKQYPDIKMVIDERIANCFNNFVVFSPDSTK